MRIFLRHCSISAASRHCAKSLPPPPLHGRCQVCSLPTSTVPFLGPTPASAGMSPTARTTSVHPFHVRVKASCLDLTRNNNLLLAIASIVDSLLKDTSRTASTKAPESLWKDGSLAKWEKEESGHSIKDSRECEECFLICCSSCCMQHRLCVSFSSSACIADGATAAFVSAEIPGSQHAP